MNYLKKFGLVFSTIAFCLSLFVITVDAQRSRSWGNRNRQNNTWQSRVWRNRNRQTIYVQQNRNYRYGRVTPQEYRQLQRKRAQLYRTRSRYSNDGYISNKERRKLQKRYNKYQRRVRRDTRDW
jgi:biopolymer transport protein ExbB/TolQ